jgi:prevent-host-death family protein
VEKMVAAAEANRRFSELLREVREGNTYIVTSHGRPVAKIVPLSNDERTGEAAHAALLEHLRSQTAVNAGKWTREELYEDDP